MPDWLRNLGELLRGTGRDRGGQVANVGVLLCPRLQSTAGEAQHQTVQSCVSASTSYMKDKNHLISRLSPLHHVQGMSHCGDRHGGGDTGYKS